MATRRVRRRAGGIARIYTWATAFADHLCVSQLLEDKTTESRNLLLHLLDQTRALWQGRPRLVRLSPPCVSESLLRALLRHRFRFLARTSWSWALSHAQNRLEDAEWLVLNPDTRARDLGPTTLGPATRHNARIILLERCSIVPGAPPDRSALVTSLLDADLSTLSVLAAHATTPRSFFGHPTWPLRDGKPPSTRPRGFAAYLRLATIGMNTLALFAQGSTARSGLSRGRRTRAQPCYSFVCPRRLHARLLTAPRAAPLRGSSGQGAPTPSRTDEAPPGSRDSGHPCRGAIPLSALSPSSSIVRHPTYPTIGLRGSAYEGQSLVRKTRRQPASPISYCRAVTSGVRCAHCIIPAPPTLRSGQVWTSLALSEGRARVEAAACRIQSPRALHAWQVSGRYLLRRSAAPALLAIALARCRPPQRAWS